MFNFLKKITTPHYSINYKKPQTFENDEYASKELYLVRTLSGARISEYDTSSKIKNRDYKFEKDCIKPFRKVKREKTIIPGISLITVEIRFWDEKFLVNDEELTEKSIMRDNELFYIKCPGDEIAIWPYASKDNQTRWYSETDGQAYFDNITVNLKAIFGMAEQMAIDSFAPGIVEIIKEMGPHLEKADYSGRKEIIKEVGKFLKDVYETIDGMNGFKTKSYLSIDELIDIKDEFDRKKLEEEMAKEKAIRDEQNDFIEQIKSRRSLLKDFNRPLNEAVSLLQSSLNDKK